MKKIFIILLLCLSELAYGAAGQILDANDEAYYITSPFDGNDLREIQYVQSNDVMYLVHRSYPPQKLSRFGHASWTIADVDWEWGPFLDQNTTTTTITPSGTTGSISLIADDDIFDANHVGALWQIIEKSDNTNTSGTLDDDESSAEIIVEGDGLLTLEGTWVGLVELEKSIVDAGSWEPVYPKLNGDAANIEYSLSEGLSGYEYRITMSSYTSGSCKYTLTAYNSDVAGYVEITIYNTANDVNATVISTLAGTAATAKWSEGAWSDYRGWPRAICFYQNRLCLAGTAYQPNGFWTSQSGDYENMKASTLDNGAIVYEVGSAKQNPILWLQDKSGIIAGTSGSLIRIASQSNNTTLTPASIGSEIQTTGGTCSIQAQLVDDSIVYVDRGKRIVRSMDYDLQSDGFVSPELTVLAEHITDPNLLEMAVQHRPDTIVWFIKGDGDMVSLTYNKKQSVLAWANQTTDGDFESVAVVPNLTNEDEVWVVVKRTIDGNDVRYIEQFQPQDWGTDPNNCFFVDSGLTYDGNSTNILTGLGHLEGETIQVFYDGNAFTEATVADGNAILDVNVTKATAGLGYTSTLLTFPLELQTQYGFTVGYKKRVAEISGCFYKTMFGQYGLQGQFTDATMYDIPFEGWPDQYLGTIKPFTGQIRLSIDGGWDDEIQLLFKQEEPFPFNLLAIGTKIEISDN